MIPEDAIHPEVTFRRWVDSFEHHLGQIPDVLSMLVTLGQPSIGVSRGGSQFDRPQVSKGGMPNEEQDLSAVLLRSKGEYGTQGPSGDARYLWMLLTGYAAAIWDRAETTRADAPNLTFGLINTAGTAKDAALLTVGWLVTHANTIHTLTELEEDREELFRTVRRLKAVHGIHPHPRKGLCGTCGRRQVEYDYTDLRDGTVVKVGVCRSCGEVYSEDTNHLDGSTK